MKTIELKWIEDDNHVVAEDAYTGLKELIETGVFPNLTVECKDDTLYITGEQEDLDKAVAKLQKSYIKYGQIAIRENHKKPEGIRIESYDANVQDIFDHTLKDFEEFKESTKHDRPTNYITKLGQFQVKFNKFKEVAAKDDKKIIDGFLAEIETLEENADALSRIKPIKKKLNEDSLDDFDDTDIRKSINAQSDEIKQFVQTQRNNLWSYVNVKMDALCRKCGCERKYKDIYVNNWSTSGRKPGATLSVQIRIPYEMYKTLSNKDISDWFYGDENCPFIPEHKNVSIYTRDMEPEVTIDFKIPEYVEQKKERKPSKPRKPRDPNKNYKKPEYINPDMKGGTYFDGDTQVYEMPEENESCKKLYNEEIKKQLSNPDNWGIIDENLLSPAEMKKKLQRVAAKWAYENGMKFDDAYNELRKKKSVKDMLDFYSVEEIIDDLKQKKTEEDDEIVESRSEPRKIKSRAELIRKAIKQDATEIESWDEYETIKENQLMNELGYSMDINGNKTGAIWMGDKDGKMYYCTNPGILIRT